MDPSKREELEPWTESQKDKSDISLNTASVYIHSKNPGPKEFTPLKRRKESGLLNDLDSPKKNKTDILTPLLRAEGKQGVRNDEHRSKQRTLMSRDQPMKDNEASLSWTPSKPYDNSITVVRHLNDSKVSK